MAEIRKRQTAHKLWISEILQSNYVQTHGEWEPNYIEYKDLTVSRVNVIATVVDTYMSEDKSFSSITIDDGTGNIRVKAFKEDTRLIDELKNGDLILVVGKVKSYDNEVYLMPEIVRKETNLHWELQRKLELLRTNGKPTIITSEEPLPQQAMHVASNAQTGTATVTEEIVLEPTPVNNEEKQKILTLLREHPDEGLEISQIIQTTGIAETEIDAYIQSLLKEGEIHAPKPGFIKII